MTKQEDLKKLISQLGNLRIDDIVDAIVQDMVCDSYKARHNAERCPCEDDEFIDEVEVESHRDEKYVIRNDVTKFITKLKKGMTPKEIMEEIEDDSSM